MDPNDKVGSIGEGAGHYLTGAEPLRYTIYFENVSTATAPAQEVTVIDQLPAAQLDLSTFSLGPVSFGTWTVSPTSDLKDWTTHVDLRPQMDLLVRIEARLNRSTGLLTWKFTSLDPATNELPEDPLAGFLPPNRTPPEGDGFVTFTVKSKAGLPSGTRIENKARIIFDDNAHIDTPTWFNTLDNTPPSSQVLALPPVSHFPTFDVIWSGTDDDSGVRNYSIYVAKDKGPFELWQAPTTETTATFTGERGHSYRFYSVARDNAGNLEAPPPGPDTGTETDTHGVLKVAKAVKFGNATAPRGRSKTLVLKNASKLEDLHVVVHEPEAGPFTVVSGAGAATIPKKKSLKVKLLFVPTAAGEAAGKLTIESSDPNNAQVEVSLTGKGR